MKLQLILLMCVASCLAAPPPPAAIRIDRTGTEPRTFSLEYTSADGTVVRQRGEMKNVGSPPRYVQILDGNFDYTAPDGKTYSVKWVADEKGFHPEGEHLPTSPPIPPEILKSLVENKQLRQ